MAADTHNSEMETRITEAVRSRLSFFRKQSSSLTFEGVRRLLEKDMGVETFTLDAHKKIIKSLLQENFYSSEDEDACGNVKENENETEKSEVENSSRSLEPLDQNVKTGDPGNLKKPDNKLSKEQKQNESEIEKPDEEEKDQPNPKKADNQINVKTESHSEVSEEIIKAAVLKRASYLRSEIESISLGGVRRLLEQDLQLEEKTLDVHKKLIANLVDKVLTTPPDESDSVKETKKNNQKKIISSKVKKNDSEEDEVKESQLDKMGDSSESAEILRDDEEMGKNKKTLKDSKSKKVRRENLDSMNVKGRKRKKESENEDKKMVKKPKKKKAVEDEDAESLKSESARSKQVESGDEIEPGENRASEDSDSGSSDNKEVKMERKKTSYPVVVHGEQVQHLKNIIKSCGMGVPPTVYKKAKQQSESKREAYLIHELVAILKKEGLSSNPTDKEIRAVKKRKERAKDLEGIDTTNIISDSRRRRAASDFFAPLPQYKVSNEDDEDSSDEEDSKSSEDDEPVIEEEESD